MTKTFPIQTKALARSMFLFMTGTVIIMMICMVGVRAISIGFDYEETFRHMSVEIFLLVIFIGAPLSGVLTAAVVVLLMRGNSITIEDDSVSGKNTMGLRKTMRLSDITEISPFSNNGISGMVIKSSARQGIFISRHVERYDDLIKLFEAQIAKNSKDSFPGAPHSSPRGDC